MPSKWMEDNTFSHPEIQQFINRDFLAVKIDVDAPGGFSDKETYQVASLPTILIFSASGKLLERIEGIATPENLLAYLKKNNHPRNKWARRPLPSPAKTIPSGQPDFSHLSKPAFAVSNQQPQLGKNAIIAPTLPMPSAQPDNPASPTSKPVVKLNKEQFGVEVAVLQEYGGVIRYVKNLERRFDQKVYIILKQTREQKNYHVVIGAYRNRQEAYRLRSFLMDHQIRGDVTALAYAKK
jgi:hypothetical protein